MFRPVLVLLVLALACVLAAPVQAAPVAGTVTSCKSKRAAAARAAKRVRLVARTHRGPAGRRARARARARAVKLARIARRCAGPAPSTRAGIHTATYNWDFGGDEQGRGCSEHGLTCPGLGGWDVPQWPELRNGQTRAVDPNAHGVPARSGGTNDRVLRASVNEAQRDSETYAAYLYKVWAVAAPETSWENEFTHQPYERMSRGQEAGSYRAWYYLPESTHTTLQHNNDDTHGWVNIFQFKHSGPDMSGTGHWNQLPEWWVNICNNDPNHIVLGVSHEGNPAYGYRNGTRSSNLPEVPFGRWFEIRADVHPGNRIDFYLDGQLFDTGRQSNAPVGLAPGNSSWIYSVGWYLNTGTAYVDDVAFDRKPADW